MKRERKNSNIESKTSENKKISSKQSKSLVTDNFVSKKNIILSILAISILTFISYFPTFDNEITSWDDEYYINTNPHLKSLDSENIKTLFNTNTYFMGNYHPLTMVSLSADYAIGGENVEGEINPFMFHLTNLVLHILVSIFVFLFVLLLLKNFNIALISALLFGVHTLHVESVAWISERKDVLYAFFFVASLVSYVKFVDTKKYFWYGISLILFLLSLFSKGQAVSLAVTIFVIDWFRQRKFSDIKIYIEKIPFFALAIYFGLIAIGAQKESEALIDEQGYTFIQRIGIASYAFMQYVYELLLPVNLSAIYPYPDIIHQTIPSYYFLMVLPVLLIVVLFVWTIIRKKNILAFGIAFFVVNIFLLLQFIPVGSATHADRYAYIPSIGFFILFSAIIVNIASNKQKFKNIVFGLTGVYIIGLVVLSMQRCDIWQDSKTLWTDTTEKSPSSVIAWNNLGSYKDRQAKKALEEFRNEDVKRLRKEAIKYFSNAIKGKPDYRNAFYNRGVSELELGKLSHDTILFKASIKDFNDALAQDGQFADAYHNRANAKAELRQLDAAIKDFDLAIQIKLSNDNFVELNSYYSNRGVTKGKAGDLDGAIKDFEEALKFSSDEASVYSNMGRAYMLKGDLQKAIEFLDKGIALDPQNYSAYLNRAVAKQKNNDLQGAISDFSTVIEIKPDFADAYFSRANILILLKKVSDACPDLKTAQKLGHPYAESLIMRYCK